MRYTGTSPKSMHLAAMVLKVKGVENTGYFFWAPSIGTSYPAFSEFPQVINLRYRAHRLQKLKVVGTSFPTSLARALAWGLGCTSQTHMPQSQLDKLVSGRPIPRKTVTAGVVMSSVFSASVTTGRRCLSRAA